EDEPPTTEVDIKKTAREDLYLILNGIDTQAGIANIKVVINPLVNWIWFGFLLLIVGTVIAFLPDRAYLLARATARSDNANAAATAAVLLVILGLGGAARAQENKMEPVGGGMELHSARNDGERKLFQQLRCLCNCMHALDECGGECGP